MSSNQFNPSVQTLHFLPGFQQGRPFLMQFSSGFNLQSVYSLQMNMMEVRCQEGNTVRYSARDSLRVSHFYCDAPEARQVQIVGDFNGWHPAPMGRLADGCWYIQEMLCHGHHQYRFLVDGVPRLDPAATGVGHDEHGERVSLIAVS
jgi:1,4-alpha-glucan branching enzyme